MRLLFDPKRSLPVTALALSDDGQWLVTGNKFGRFQLWNSHTGSLHKMWADATSPVEQIVFLQSGQFVSTNAGRVDVWSDPEGTEHWTIGSLPWRLWITPNGQALVTTYWQEIGCIRLHDDIPARTAWSDSFFSNVPTRYDTRLRLTGTTDRVFLCDDYHQRMESRNVDDGRVLQSMGVPFNSIDAVRVSPDASILAWINRQTLNVLDFQAGHLFNVSIRDAVFRSLAWHSSSGLIITGDSAGKVRYWDARTRSETAQFDWMIGDLQHLAVSADGLCAAAVGERGQIVIWDIDF